MSITSALSSALSGLNANARAASVVSSNLANIQTDGYGRREIDLSHDRYSGVRVTAVTRHVDPGVLSDRRLADGALAQSEARAGFLTAIRSTVGTPDQPGSLSARLAAFEGALISAASKPESVDRLQALSLRAADVVQGFNAASGEIQKQRMTAEDQISAAVRSLNVDLAQVQDLNVQIQVAQRGGADSASLLDHRQAVIDRIADLVPVREIPRDDGAVALMTPGGTFLLDSSAAEFEFTRSNMILPHMTTDAGLLSGLRIGGRAVQTSGPQAAVAGGKLSALFDIRDTMAVDAQAKLDSVARDLVERFQDPSVNPTPGAGNSGLFTDEGAGFTGGTEVGLAGRMRLNASVDVNSANEVWRLRDGLGAAAPGPSGNAALLDAMKGALAAQRPVPSGALGPREGSAAYHMDSFVSQLAQSAVAEDRTTSFAAVRQSELQIRLSSDGVNSDEETQKLLLIEQAYGANARMIQTLDEMMQTLLRI